MVEVSIIDRRHDWHMVKNLDQMQKMWSDIIITRKGTTKDFAD
jgi:hypothetical protein